LSITASAHSNFDASSGYWYFKRDNQQSFHYVSAKRDDSVTGTFVPGPLQYGGGVPKVTIKKVADCEKAAPKPAVIDHDKAFCSANCYVDLNSNPCTNGKFVSDKKCNCMICTAVVRDCLAVGGSKNAALNQIYATLPYGKITDTITAYVGLWSSAFSVINTRTTIAAKDATKGVTGKKPDFTPPKNAPKDTSLWYVAYNWATLYYSSASNSLFDLKPLKSLNANAGGVAYIYHVTCPVAFK
jgi:hypothetical protein